MPYHATYLPCRIRRDIRSGFTGDGAALMTGGSTVAGFVAAYGVGDAGGGGAAVVIVGNAIQFHCMEGVLPNTSNPPKDTTQRFAFSRFITMFGRVLTVSILFGFIVLIAVYRLPYSRIVVHNQPTSTAVKITSAKLMKPGFIVIYMQEEGGWKEVGSSWYLEPGYYRDIVIDIGYQQTIEALHKDNVTGNFEPRNFTARLYEYKGTTYEFDEDIDTPVTDPSGKIYQKRFWFYSYGHPFRRFFVRLQDEPFSYLWDLVWP